MIGVDTSAAMLEHARKKVPEGEFHEADLHQLPLPDDHVDLVVCGLALMHARTSGWCWPSSSASYDPAAIW